MGLRDQEHDVVFTEPIVEKKDCEVEIVDVGLSPWIAKAGEHVGKAFNACKLQLVITDKDIRTETEGAKARTVLDDVFNLEPYPYMKDGEPRWMTIGKVYELEAAFGFEPVYVDASGNKVPPHVSRTGKKYAPKVEGVKRKLNPAFVEAYFDESDSPKVMEWVGKKLRAHVAVRKSEQYGDKNVVKRYLPAE